MAPTLLNGLLSKRYNSCNEFDDNGNCYDQYNSWGGWGRWVVLVAIVVVVLLVFFIFSCINSRRRRRAGLAPRYGTGWLAGNTPPGHNRAQYTNNYYSNEPYDGGAAPPYSPPVNQQYTGNTFNSNEGYYGQQSGVEMQPPQNAYQPQRGGDPVYDAPQGPPPKKGQYDGVIR